MFWDGMCARFHGNDQAASYCDYRQVAGSSTGSRTGFQVEHGTVVPSKLRIAIATAGRFHVFDLARELHALGHDVILYSYVPRQRARQFGIRDECYVSLLPFATPALIWDRLAPRFSSLAREWFLYRSLNWAVMSRLDPCDVFICMSGGRPAREAEIQRQNLAGTRKSAYSLAGRNLGQNSGC
jgi:hypothetical protein